MGDIPFFDIPNKPEHIIQLCGSHATKVLQVGSPNGECDVKVVFPGSEESSNWMPDMSLACGDDKRKNHTGLFAPAQPGQSGYFIFLGTYRKPGFIKGGAFLDKKGKA